MTQPVTDRRPTASEAPPLWVMLAVGGGLACLMLLAIGFYWDIGWHVDHGRDEYLFTPPHVAIIVGLVALFGTSILGVAAATRRDRPADSLRVRGLYVPWSMLALAAMGLGGIASFPIDELWHTYFGLDSTLWSPPHLMMLGTGALGTLALWFALVEGGVPPSRSRMAWLAHVAVAAFALTAASSFLVEFENGAARWQLLYHPVLVVLIAGIVLTAARTVLGRGGAVATVIGYIALRLLFNAVVGGALDHTTPVFALLIVPALAVELAGLIAPPREGGARFAGGAALGLLVIGLPAEWAWNLWTGRHAWTEALLPEAILLTAAAALGGALLGALLGGALRGSPRATPGPVWVAVGSVAVLACLAVPYPRTAPDVDVAIEVERTDGAARIAVELDPPDAAVDARWFEVLAMNGGGLHHEELVPVARGRYATEGTVPVGGEWKTLVRLHRGTALLAAPVSLRADPEHGLEAVEPTDRRVTFEPDRAYMERETHDGPPGIAIAVTSGAVVVALAWIGLLAWCGRRRLLAAGRTWIPPP